MSRNYPFSATLESPAEHDGLIQQPIGPEDASYRSGETDGDGEGRAGDGDRRG
jgi:hypothetical protein